ncbi:MAG TPA: hypothetical protein PKL13_00610 [bacterium]|nr:hypothetical protein [bacterium]
MEKEKQKTKVSIGKQDEPTDEEIKALSNTRGLNNRLHLLDEDGLIPEPRGLH